MPRSLLLSPALTLLAGFLVAGPVRAQDPAWFEEVGDAVGLDWRHVSGAAAHPGTYWFPEVMGGGVALFDYDGDGDLDVYLVQSGHIERPEGANLPGNKLFRNDLDGQGGQTFVDVTAEARVGSREYGMGAACGDYDQDGDVDLYVTNLGPNVLYRNEGDETFQDVTENMKVGDVRWGTSAAFFDADLDGDLDLFVVNNLNWSKTIEQSCVNYRNQPDYCSPENYNSRSTDQIYLQGARLGFNSWSQKLGLLKTNGNGLGVCVADYDKNGTPDVYVANDATPNALWRNVGGADAFRSAGLEEVALRGGCAVNASGTPEAGMGVQWVDVDQDGWLDLFMTHLRRESNTFYRNTGQGRFRDLTRRTQLAAPSLKFTGFGMGFHDFDQDGQLDLYVANGAVQAWGEDEWFDPADPYAEPNHLFRGLGDGKFEHVGEGTASPLIGSSRGAAFGDLDEDGDVDVVVVDRDARVKVLRNVAPKQGDWIGFSVLNRKGATALGAVVRLETSMQAGDERKSTAQYRLVDPAYSYLSSNDPRVVFGVPAGHRVDAVEVQFLGAQEPRRFEGLATGAYHVLR